MEPGGQTAGPGMDLSQIRSVDELEAVLSQPYPEDVEAAPGLRGGLLVLGAGGKMGPTLVRRAVQAFRQAGIESPVVAVSRFRDPAPRRRLEEWGAQTIAADLMEESELAALPRLPNVIFMAGMKFGSTGAEDTTWAMNAYLPGRIAQTFRQSRIVAFSTGNVYPLVSPGSGGSREDSPVGPVGEYAQSCLGRERVLRYFSTRNATPMCLLRLNYAVEARYGVLLDIATRVWEGSPVPLAMGYANVIWQGDANSVCLRSFQLCDVPASILNLTGPGILSVRRLAEEFGRRLGRDVIFDGEEAPTALLNDASRCHRIFGPPRIGLEQMLDLVAAWVRAGGATLGKPTRFEARDGRF